MASSGLGTPASYGKQRGALNGSLGRVRRRRPDSYASHERRRSFGSTSSTSTSAQQQGLDGAPKILTVSESEDQAKKLETQNFELKMQVYYLKESLQSYKGGEEAARQAGTLVDLKNALEAKELEVVELHQELRALIEYGERDQAELHRIREEAARLRTERDEIAAALEAKWQAEVVRGAERLREEKRAGAERERKLFQQIDVLQGDLNDANGTLANQANLVERYQILHQDKMSHEGALRQLGEVVAGLRGDLGAAGEELCGKDFELQRLRAECEAVARLEQALREKDLQLHALQGEGFVLSEQLGSQAAEIETCRKQVHTVKSEAETVTAMEAEEIARLYGLVHDLRSELEASKEKERAAQAVAEEAAAVVGATRTEQARAKEEALAEQRKVEAREREYREEIEAARTRAGRLEEQLHVGRDQLDKARKDREEGRSMQTLPATNVHNHLQQQQEQQQHEQRLQAVQGGASRASERFSLTLSEEGKPRFQDQAYEGHDSAATPLGILRATLQGSRAAAASAAAAAGSSGRRGEGEQPRVGALPGARRQAYDAEPLQRTAPAPALAPAPAPALAATAATAGPFSPGRSRGNTLKSFVLRELGRTTPQEEGSSAAAFWRDWDAQAVGERQQGAQPQRRPSSSSGGGRGRGEATFPPPLRRGASDFQTGGGDGGGVMRASSGVQSSHAGMVLSPPFSSPGSPASGQQQGPESSHGASSPHLLRLQQQQKLSQTHSRRRHSTAGAMAGSDPDRDQRDVENAARFFRRGSGNISSGSPQSDSDETSGAVKLDDYYQLFLSRAGSSNSQGAFPNYR